ncbi:hypothetical protein EVAR_77662_1 [Eumeta japonica]|uniref:Uncharacterized protein n=1 Tax=Eumeta variegata TaxID=151549 RepID=A0A4C1T9X4_EUMVA|nr:hypothetical protein EVAR_77662_1 [Eumeta japonica]
MSPKQCVKHSEHIQERDIEQLNENSRKTKAPYTTISRPNTYSETQDKTWRPTMTCGLVYLDEQATKITGKAKYKTPENDPIVVMTRDTKVALEERT